MSDKKIGFDTAWREKYQGLIATPDEAVARLRPGQFRCRCAATGRARA